MKPSRLLLALLAIQLALAIGLGTLEALAIGYPRQLHALSWGLLLCLLVIAGVDALWLRRLPTPEVRR